MKERGDLVHDEKGHWEVAPRMNWNALPARVEGVIQKRIGRLDSDLRETLTVASVEGEVFTAEVIARVLGIEEQALVRHLSGELDKRHRLVRATGIERLGTQRLSRYRFRHNLFQGYLYNSLDEVERAYRHEAVGNELEELYAQQEEEIAGIAGQLARHFHEAGDDQRALKYYTQAGDRAVRLYAYEEARQFLQRALKLSEADDSLLEQRTELLENLADVQGLQGDSPDAIPLYQEALDLRHSVEGGDKWTTIRLHRKIGETWNSINSMNEFLRLEAQAQASLEDGLELVETEPPHLETIRLMITVSRSAYWKEIYGTTPEWDTAEHYARVALEMAEQLDAPIELSAALGSLVRVYGARGLWRERVKVARQRLNVSREAHFEDLRENLDILTQIGQALMGVGEYAQAIPHLLEAEALGDQLQDVHGKAMAVVNQGQCWLRLDRWDEVLIAEEKLKALQRRHPLERLGSICWLLSFSAAVHALRGDNEQAMQLRNESYEIMIALTVTEENWVRENHY
jgi:tetratricopeptide (TPR) repeat protein